MCDSGDPGTRPTPDRVAEVFPTLLRDWLTDLDLVVSYEQPRCDGGPSLADLVAERLGVRGDDPRAVRRACERRLVDSLQQRAVVLRPDEQAHLFARLYAELLGAGPIDPLLHDPAVAEILVNGPQQVYVERRGRLEQVPITFADDAHVVRTIQRLLAPHRRTITAASPLVDVRLADGSMLSAAIPPVAISGPSMTIRKVYQGQITVEDLIRFGTLTREMADVITTCVRARLNLIVSGGTGSGKTTVLNVLAGCIPESERIITVEEFATLQVRHPHVVTLERQPPDRDGGGVSVRDLLRAATRMRPDRLIVGDLSGPEILDFLQIINRGHDGSLASVVAESPEQALDQIELLIKFHHPDLPISYLRSFIGATIDLVVQCTRLHDGRRRIVAITEVRATHAGYTLQPIFTFRQHGLDPQGRIAGQYHQVHPISAELARRLLALDHQWLSPAMVRLIQQGGASPAGAGWGDAPGHTTRVRRALERFAALVGGRRARS